MEKQIEEMAKVLSGLCCTNKCKNCKYFYNKYDDVGCVDMNFAEKLYSKGYRKASDVAREIFEEIEEEIKLALESNYKAEAERMKKPIVDMADEFLGWVDGKITALRGIEGFIAELKKKYIGKDTNVTTKESEGEK